jgi:hypothetical protein
MKKVCYKTPVEIAYTVAGHRNAFAAGLPILENGDEKRKAEPKCYLTAHRPGFRRSVARFA